MAVRLATVERWNRQAEKTFTAFKEAREQWLELLERDLKAALQPELGANEADYRTGAIERARNDYVDLLTMNPTRFDANPTRLGSRSEEQARKAAIWVARLWARDLDPGRKYDTEVAGDQVPLGVAMQRLLYHEQPEPEARDLKERDEEMRRTPTPWYLRQVNPLNCRWFPVHEPTVIIWEYELPLMEATDTFSRVAVGEGGPKDQRMTLDKLGKVAWVGQDEQIDEKLWDKTVHVLICEYQDKKKTCPCCPDKHPLWSGIEVVYGSGKVSQGSVTDEYTLPYKHAPSLRIIPGRRANSRDPNKAFRALIHGLYVEGAWINYLESALATAARRDMSDRSIYLSRERVPKEVLGELPEGGIETPYKLSDIGDGYFTVVAGRFLRFPAEASPMFLEMLKAARERFNRELPNPFLLGSNFEEASQGTGSANLSATQQARFPLSRLLAEDDNAIQLIVEDILHSIRYWDYEAKPEEERRYYVTATGGEELMRGGAKAGESLYMSASMIESGFEITLKTSAETLQEQAERRRQAIEGLKMGAITSAQFIQDWGYADADHQMRELRKERLKKRNEGLKAAAQDEIVKALFLTLADIMVPPAAAGVPPSPPAAGAPPGEGMPQPTVRLPALDGPSGGASPVEAMV